MTNSKVSTAQVSKLKNLSEEESRAIEEAYPIKTFDKGTYLLKAGQIAKEGYSVVQGCIRRFSIVDGEEITTDFYTEGHTAADFNSIASQAPSRHFFVCVEKTTVTVNNAEKEAAFYKKFPRFETMCRMEFERMMGEKADKVEAFAQKSPEERYLYLLEERPDLLSRVPQYQIASYLGVKPETLSRIRKRITIK
ncbi:MAG: Crp/Fnr family transcriptional regulator [Imperialibacter sp.]|uniref:Crp/Fnr family transcriptional regulator n=1 Tax=Imperialibacter sp. TaxID=2038411 RepID=UPI0032EC6E42